MQGEPQRQPMLGCRIRLFKRHGRQTWVCEGFSSETVGGLKQSRHTLYIYVVVCLFVAGMHNDTKLIWCWLIANAVLGAE